MARNALAMGAPEAPQPETVKQRLLAVLAQQAADAKERFGDHEIAEVDEAQYVMAAMADEVFLHIDWPGRDEWAGRPLETEAHFGTHMAGDRIFDRLEEIFKDHLSVSGELLSVYLAALSLGFRGRYRFDPQSPDPERVRRDLIRELRRVEPRMVAPAIELCPEVIAGVRDKEPRRGLTSLREGLLPLVAVIAAMVIIGHGLWYYRTSDVRDKLDQIETQKKLVLEARERLEKSRREAREKTEPPAEPDAGAQ